VIGGWGRLRQLISLDRKGWQKIRAGGPTPARQAGRLGILFLKKDHRKPDNAGGSNYFDFRKEENENWTGSLTLLEKREGGEKKS